MIVGTAGHIDHGKTTLVRALTGVDTDRLKEEKERGISIELGYAYTPLENGEVLGYIDVPGHERLIHTMVAGACGIDFALLVVAADDCVMPQTREHLAILELLDVRQGAVALTKIDRVDQERIQQAQAQVRDLLAPTRLSDARLFAVNATTPEDPGIQALRDHLHALAAQMMAKRDDGLFRLAVDRVFTLPGHGTVVTGTVFSGRVSLEDSIVIMPAGKPVRVRSIHAQNRPVETGHAGQRCALNLAGVEKSEITRGDWLADPRALAPSTHVDVRLQLLPGTHRPLERWAPLHVHLGTTHRVAHLVPLESDCLCAGSTERVQLVFDAPICAAPGDRFIVRDAQAMRTIGGGLVLDPFAPSRKRRSPERLRYLDALERLINADSLSALLHEAPHGLKMTDLVRLTGRPAERITTPADAVAIEAGRERFVVEAAHWRTLREHALTALRAFHEQEPDEPGPDIGRLRRIALPQLPDLLWRALIDELASECTLIRTGPWVHLPDHVVRLSESEQTLAHKLQPLIAAGRFDPPWVRDLAIAVKEPEERVRAVLRKLVTQGAVYQVVRDLFYDRERMVELTRILDTLHREHGAVHAAEYRDAVGLGRKRAIQILEFFDRVGYTRRVRDAHLLRGDSGWRVS
jgi:selenocysteine-specific elongation factor